MSELFDFASLNVEDVVEAPEHAGGKQRKYEHNPFLAWLRDSYNTEVGKAVPLKPAALKDAIAMIRDAAEDLGIGSKIRVYAKGQLVQQKEINGLHPNVNVTLKFWGVEKRKHTRKDTAPVTPEPLDNYSEDDADNADE